MSKARSTQTAVEPREIELKLEILPRDIDRMIEAATAHSTPIAETTLTADYFDTGKHKLRKAGLSLRIRHDGERRIQTVKAAAGASAGLFDRSEWEVEIDGTAPDIGADASPLAQVVGAKALRQLAPVFRSEVTRASLSASMDDAVIEIAIDRGTIETTGASATVCELELELEQGPVTGLFALARRFDAVGPVRLGVLSKADRGYGLVTETSHLLKSAPPDLSAAMTAGSAFQAIAWSCIREFRLSEMVLLDTDDEDALHRARVGLRRLRSAISLFKPVIADERSALLQAGLKRLAAVLGDARNLDVMIARELDPKLRRRLQTARKRAYATARKALNDPAARRLMLDLAEWLTVGDWDARAGSLRAPRVLPFAAERLERLRRRLKHAGGALADLDDEDRHGLRIKAKKLRYATEFFSSLLTAKKDRARHKHFRRLLAELQEVLGELNDQSTGHAVLVKLGLADAGSSPPVDPVQRDKLIRNAVRTTDAVLDARRFW